MNSIFKAGVRACLSGYVNPSRSILPVATKHATRTPAYSRTLWHMCSSNSGRTDQDKFLKPQVMTECCQCGCSGLLHTKGEKELVDFLKEEITAERRSQKLKTLPHELDGFTITTDGADMTLTKTTQLETITVNLNVNDSVVTDSEPELNPTDDNPDTGEMKSKPSFKIDITRRGKTVSFTCSYVEPEDNADNNYSDVFGIDEVAYLEGEWNDKVYSVAGDVLDGYLYDLFMTLLEEKGISNDFADKLSDLATSYEHSRYIGLLENLSKFASLN